jgi:hypothetical protein
LSIVKYYILGGAIMNDIVLLSYTSNKWKKDTSIEFKLPNEAKPKEKETLDTLKKMFIVRAEILLNGKPFTYSFRLQKVTDETVNSKLKQGIKIY